MLPVLTALSDGQACTAAALRDRVAEAIDLTEGERAERIPSGSRVFDSRVHWAVTYMVQAGLLDRPKRGVVELTDRGRRLLDTGPRRVDNDVLSQFPEFVAFMSRSTSRTTRTPESAEVEVATTPRERLAHAVDQANTAVSSELLARIRKREPAFLEELVLELLTAMGYGGREGVAEHLGQSGDQGLDGVIRQDALGLDRVYVQAKRYSADRSIGRPDIQGFVGALHGAQADRGIFITTSRFTAEAQDYAERVPARIVLIDADRLGELLVRHDIGVQAEETFVLKRIDEDYFES